jgi:hypothetical protein
MMFDGRNGGTVELLENVLVIRRNGVASFLTQGLKGEKRIPYSSITSVQFKEAGFTTGYIQFAIVGGIESRGGVWDATTDENTVLFTKEASPEFHRLREIVEQRAAAARAGTHVLTSRSVSISEELTRLADLRDRGVLSDDEFAEQKAAVLGKASMDGPSVSTSRHSGPSVTPIQISPGPDSQSEIKANPTARAIGFVCLGMLAIFVLFSAIGSRIVPTDASTASNKKGPANAAALVIASEDLTKNRVAASLSQPVMIGLNGPQLDACGSNATVAGLSAKGDNFLAVKSAPRLDARRIDKLGPAAELYVCDRSKDGKWLGVVYEPDGQTSASCGVTSPVATAHPYSGRCQSGWVYSKYVEVYAG